MDIKGPGWRITASSRLIISLIATEKEIYKWPLASGGASIPWWQGAQWNWTVLVQASGIHCYHSYTRQSNEIHYIGRWTSAQEGGRNFLNASIMWAVWEFLYMLNKMWGLSWFKYNWTKCVVSLLQTHPFLLALCFRYMDLWAAMHMELHPFQASRIPSL
jgi:hypothetical protein